MPAEMPAEMPAKTPAEMPALNATTSLESKQNVSRYRRAFRRIVLRTVLPAFGALVLLAILLWIGVHRIPWLGSALADGVRAIVGPAPVAWAEDVAYALQDRVNRWRFVDESPQPYWDISEETASGASSTAAAPLASASPDSDIPPHPSEQSFPPDPVSPPFSIVAASGDGVWVPVLGRAQVGGTSAMVKTMLHPDEQRRYTILAVVAIDVSRVRVHAVAGTVEPRGNAFSALMRSGSIPVEHHAALIAAFNGGFQTVHGNYAMMVDGNAVGEPQSDSCTVGLYRDGSIRIRSWEAIESEVGLMKAYRQTPRCLVENGVRHADLENRYNTSWGAVVDKGTVIRRSALGISEDGKTLYFGMGDSLTARSLADGMKCAGAHDVAQLDVNHVYPRFVFFAQRPDGKLAATEPLCRGFDFSPNDYANAPMARDFFYLTSAM